MFKRPFSRRRLLQLSLLLSASRWRANVSSAPLNRTNPAAAAKSALNRIIVVGAGASGLAAARALQASGWEVVLLEARDRIGGRIWTDRSLEGIPLDLGASWIHGTHGNPVTALAEQFKAATVATDYESLTLYDADGAEVSDGRQAEISERWEELLSAARGTRGGNSTDTSLLAALEEVMRKENLTARQRMEMQYCLNSRVEHEFASEASDLSLLEWDQGSQWEGPDVIFSEGYDQIARGLARDLDIRLNHVVSRIDYGGAGVTVMTNHGALVCERCLVTLPLGVLKSGSVLFDPPLPARHQQALARLNMGVLNKVYLKFPEVFWERASHLLGYMAPGKGEWSEFLNVFRYLGKPVLLGFNAGQYGLSLESMSDPEIIAAAMQVLRRIYGGSIPQPTAWRITRWGQDPFARGSYSHIPPGASGEDYESLAQPVMDRIYFAGEATSKEHAATVHGALLSGQREAARIGAPPHLAPASRIEIRRSADGPIQLEWPTQARQNYQVQVSSNLSEWKDHGSPTMGDGNLRQLPIPAKTEWVQFYRLKID